MLDEAHRHADIAAGVAAELESSNLGSAQLLWIEPEEDRQDPEVAWAVVRLGGNGGATKCVVITGYTDNYTAFRARDINEDGDPTGAEFTVYAFSHPTNTVAAFGNLDLRSDIDPYYEVGDPLRVQWQNVYLKGGRGWTEGWFAVETFRGKCDA